MSFTERGSSVPKEAHEFHGEDLCTHAKGNAFGGSTVQLGKNLSGSPSQQCFISVNCQADLAGIPASHDG